MLAFEPSRDGVVRVFVGDGFYDCCLRIGELKTLQEKAKAGPGVILSRLRNGLWTIEDVYESVRLGLIGAGMEPQAAYTLLEQTFRSGHVLKFIEPATLILLAALVGVEDDNPPGEQTAPTNETAETLTPMETSSGQASTNSPGQRATRRAKSTK